jgi:di/tricarboxylate transporter
MYMHCQWRAGVVSWKQCLSDNQAWDTLTWFAALIAMAAYLNKFGFIAWFSDKARLS